MAIGFSNMGSVAWAGAAWWGGSWEGAGEVWDREWGGVLSIPVGLVS